MKDEDDIIIKSNDIPEAPEEENKIVGENRISEVENKTCQYKNKELIKEQSQRQIQIGYEIGPGENAFLFFHAYYYKCSSDNCQC